ncbi:hypothetical protein, partial [Devosia sp.]|uniref:hypothetical protein n=1 Tax=Devosia sp. TaxID=1871048 RepID=UPI001ACA8925
LRDLLSGLYSIPDLDRTADHPTKGAEAKGSLVARYYFTGKPVRRLTFERHCLGQNWPNGLRFFGALRGRLAPNQGKHHD